MKGRLFVNRERAEMYVLNSFRSKGNIVLSVLSEYVDNSIGAKAKKVALSFKKNKTIVLVDDGTGILKKRIKECLMTWFGESKDQKSDNTFNRHGGGIKFAGKVFKKIEFHTKAEGEDESCIFLKMDDDGFLHASDEESFNNIVSGDHGSVVVFSDYVCSENAKDENRTAIIKEIDKYFGFRYQSFINDGVRIFLEDKNSDMKKDIEAFKFLPSGEAEIDIDIDSGKGYTVVKYKGVEKKVFSLKSTYKTGKRDTQIRIPEKDFGINFRIRLQHKASGEGVDKSGFMTGIFMGPLLLHGNIKETLKDVGSSIGHNIANVSSLSTQESLFGGFEWDGCFYWS